MDRLLHPEEDLEELYPYVGDLDEPSPLAEALALAAGDTAGALPAQPTWPFAQRQNDDRQQTDGDDAPAEERDRERRNAACNPAREDHVGNLRGGDQQEAEQTQRLTRPVRGAFGQGFGHVPSSACDARAIFVMRQGIGSPSPRRTHFRSQLPTASAR